MSMIFDRFPTIGQAQAFARDVTERFGRETQVYDNADDAQAADPFPFELEAPVVHVDRLHEEEDIEKFLAGEQEVERLVTGYGGVFAGT